MLLSLLPPCLALVLFVQDPGSQDSSGAQDSSAADPSAEDPNPDAEELPDEWPRTYDAGKSQVLLYQPQVDEWTDHAHLEGRAALAVTLNEGVDPVFGALFFEVDTATDHETREVKLDNFKISELNFPGASDTESLTCAGVVQHALPFDEGMLVSLDRILAALDAEKAREKEAPVNVKAPPIYYSETPAILVIFIGEPRFEKATDDLMFAVNTNWDVFLHMGSSQYYLLNGESWLTSPDVKAPVWAPVAALPAALSSLPDDDNWKNVRENLPGKPVKVMPRVQVSTTPAELILTDGPASYSPIGGTQLLYATNTECDLFLDSEQKSFYFLTAGRWFRAKELSGPWTSAMTDLPEDFAKIPKDHEKASVLSSVPGTEEADAAVLLASVPQKATVQRNDVSVTVEYDGAPAFRQVENCTVYYATNTEFDVFRVNGMYYCCSNGVWFVSVNATGPWVVADTVPAAIYTIPPECPKYYVTYVQVYDSTPTTVVVGYTSGYTGCYVSYGVVMFGCGYYSYPYYWGYPSYYYSCYPRYYSYGCGAHYNYHSGTWYRGHGWYGPYGGAGRAAAYNPRTGTWGRGAYRYGPEGSVYGRRAYNPRTGTRAAAVSAQTPYGYWGRGVVSNGDKWARVGYRQGSQGSVGAIRTSEGGAAVRVKGPQGGRTTIAKDRHGDVYAGRNGQIYRKDGDQWQKRENGGWSNVDRERATQSSREGSPRVADRSSSGNQASIERALSDRAARDRSRESSTLGNRAENRSGLGSQTTDRRLSNPRSSYSNRSSSSRSTMDRLQRDSRSRQLGSQRARSVSRGRSGGFGGSRGGRGGRRR